MNLNSIWNSKTKQKLESYIQTSQCATPAESDHAL